MGEIIASTPPVKVFDTMPKGMRPGHRRDDLAHMRPFARRYFRLRAGEIKDRERLQPIA
ncbi:MAG TPA: hypothetical protein VHD83_26520 [Puia sp.]|nr:hypothetical protein [Puia sp.]